jgi:dephospho-CoA kinase
VSKWAGKYVIGLTGNIGTGKSVVRRMLEHHGAFGIDADALAHRAIAKGAPGYDPVLGMFGRWLVGPDGEILRARLGRVVFSDPEALAVLEGIVHPLVRQAIDFMVRRSKKQVVAVEAIKLLESGLGQHCDSIWVVTSPPEVQLARLVQKRSMSEVDARQRITAQPPQQAKISAAQVVIQNGASLEETWKQVWAAWQKNVPGAQAEAPAQDATPAPDGQLMVTRGRPRDAAAIARLVNRVGAAGSGAAGTAAAATSDSIMGEFGEKAFLLLHLGGNLVGAAGWQVENLVARTTDLYLDPGLPLERALPPLVAEMERASKDLQCEAALVLTSPGLTGSPVWKRLGYEARSPQALGVSAWQEAAREILQPGQTLYFKQLRQDRVLRPI